MSTSAVPSISSGGGPKVTRGHSCVLCSSRKVRCDGGRPCANCIRAKVECVSAHHGTPRRKRKIESGEEVLGEKRRVGGRKDLLVPEGDGVEVIKERLRRAEEVLREHGLTVGGSSDGSDLLRPRRLLEEQVGRKEGISVRGRLKKEVSRNGAIGGKPGAVEDGKLIVERGNSRYVESQLWAGLSEEIQDSRDLIQALSEDEAVDAAASQIPDGAGLIFGRMASTKSILSSHPAPVKIFQLWQTFIDNVNPLVKAIHVPTTQMMVIEASGNLEKIGKPTEALLFAIYHCAVVSLRNEDCEKMFGESKATLMSKFSYAMQQALINAEVLKTSNLMVLQALTYYLLSIRQYSDADTLWMLSGIAMRIGQRIGLHRESAAINLSVFEAEMRRRLWWQMLILDNRSAQLSGIYTGHDTYSFSDSQFPRNLNDSDLYPTMKELPAEHVGPTEMLFCCIRHEVGSFIKETKSWKAETTNPHSTADMSATLRARDQSIDELEARLEKNYLQYCDLSVPLHLLGSLMARTAVAQMSLMAHHPRTNAQVYENLPQREKDFLFLTSLRMIEYDNVGHAHKEIYRYLWHINVFFQLDAFIHILSELRYRVTGEQADHSWQQVEQVYDYHPEMLNNTRHTVYFAIGNVAVKAWERRVLALQHAQRGHPITTPKFMIRLLSQRKRKGGLNMSEELMTPSASSADGRAMDPTAGMGGLHDDEDEFMPGYEDQFGDLNSGLDPTLLPGYIPMDMDWPYWQTLFEGDTSEAHPAGIMQ